MIGIVVVTHARLAQELLTTAEMIIGPFPAARAISVDRGTSLEAAKAELHQAIAEVSQDGHGVLILTDMFGGTPTNISAEFLCDQVEILAGVNLPVLLKCVQARNGLDLASLAGMLKEYARNAVIRPAELLAPKNC